MSRVDLEIFAAERAVKILRDLLDLREFCKANRIGYPPVFARLFSAGDAPSTERPDDPPPEARP